ncbi:MAG: LuxR C-terminal-related transcriptional regulator [Thermodesulfobacteriota bacterium]
MSRFISEFPLIGISVPRFAEDTRHLYLSADFRKDLSGLFPYLNRVLPRARWCKEPLFLGFCLEGVFARLYPELVAAGPFEDREAAHRFVYRLIEAINDAHERKEEIEPRFEHYSYISPLSVLKVLPGTNCGKCGFATCIAFAAFVSRSRVEVSDCPHVAPPVAAKMVYPVFGNDGRVQSYVELYGKPEAPFRERRPRATEPAPASTAPKEPGEQAAPLTGRELEILRLVAEGFTNSEICRALAISPHTVKAHVDHIFNKLNVSDRTQAAVWGVRHGLL